MKKFMLVLMFLSMQLFAEDHALVVGCCGEYKDKDSITLLKGTQNDAKKIYDILLERGVPKKNIDYLVESDATYHNITSKLKAKKKSNLDKGDTLYVFYSGHGTSVGDDSAFGRKLSSNQEILKRLNNSAGLIPYDFDLSDPKHTLVITSRDFKPTFQYLDAKGVNIVWIADACYVGNGHRDMAPQNPKKRQQLHNMDDAKKASLKKENSYYAQKANDPYKNLIFYGATLTANMTGEVKYKNQNRGAFSVEVEKCLNKKYQGANITNKDLKGCLERNFVPFVISSAIYPMDERLDDNVIMKAPKSVSVKPEKLLNFREKLFALQSQQVPLKINVSSTHAPELSLDTFCYGELLEINVKNKLDKEYVMAFTMDKEKRVIMLTPNKNTSIFSETDNVVEANVTEPFGKDKVKVFSTTNESLYHAISQFKDRQYGVLKDGDVQKVYEAFKKSGDFKSAYLEVKTVSTDVRTCRNGDL